MIHGKDPPLFCAESYKENELENQLFFSDDSTNRILSIQGMNEVRADALEEEAVEGYTEIYVFYIAGFRKVGTGGTYEKENTK